MLNSLVFSRLFLSYRSNSVDKARCFGQTGPGGELESGGGVPLRDTINWNGDTGRRGSGRSASCRHAAATSWKLSRSIYGHSYRGKVSSLYFFKRDSAET